MGAGDRKHVILVTGGAGYIGSLLVSRLLEAGHEVRVLDALLFGGESLAPFARHSRFTLRKGDAWDVEEHESLYAGVNAVVHLAALVGFPACQAVGPEVAWRYNHDMTRRVYHKARESGARRFVFASTYSNYGMSEDGRPVTEDSPLKPQSLYAETKIAAETFLLDQASSSCAPVILRLSTLYGVSPRTRFDLLVNQFVLEALTRRKLIIYQRGYSRSFVHVFDAVRAMETALFHPDEGAIRGQVYNVGSEGGNYTKTQLVDMVRDVVPGVEVQVKDLSFGGDMRDIRVAFAKIENALGYRTEVSVREGIREVAAAIETGVISEPGAAKYRNAQFIVQ